MICNQAPHGNLLRPAIGEVMLRLSVVPIVEVPDHVRVLLFEELAELRRIDAGNGIVRVKLHSRELAQMVDALTVFSAAHGNIIALRRCKCFQPINRLLNLVYAPKQRFFNQRHRSSPI